MTLEKYLVDISKTLRKMERANAYLTASLAMLTKDLDRIATAQEKREEETRQSLVLVEEQHKLERVMRDELLARMGPPSAGQTPVT